MKKIWELFNMSFRDFNSRGVIKSHAELILKTADKLLFVIAGIMFTPLIAEGKLLGGFYAGLFLISLIAFILLRNFGYKLLAELENGDKNS